MRLAAFIAGLCISTGALSAGTSPRAVVETFLKDQALVNKGLIDKKALWDSVDDSSLGQTYGTRWSEIKPQINFNGFKHETYSILRVDGNFVIAGVSKADWGGRTGYSLFQTRKGTFFQYLIEPGHFGEKSRYVNPHWVDFQGLISSDSPTSKPRNYLTEFCAALQLRNPTKTQRSDVVAAYLRLQGDDRNISKLWSNLDTSVLEETIGAKNLQNIKASVKVNSYSVESFKIDREFGDFVLVSVPNKPHRNTYLVFNVRKSPNGNFKITPGRLMEEWIEPWAMEFTQYSETTPENDFSRIGRYCSEITQ